MSQIINVPFNGQEIGQGFNFESRESIGTGLSVANVSEDPSANGQIVTTSFKSVTTQESLMESLGMSASADVRHLMFSGGAKVSFAESHAVNSFSSFIAGRCEVHNAVRRGHGFRLTPEAEALVSAGNMGAFKTAFGDMFVRSLKTGGEFYVVARITSVSEEHQSEMSASLHGEYNGIASSGSFKASFDKAMKETKSRSEVMVFMGQAGGIGKEASFTGPDAAKILERLSQFPQSAHEHPVGYEAELATYDTIPIPIPTPEEREDRNIVLADCLAQKMGFLKALSDLEFLLGPSGAVFFDDLPAPAELEKMKAQYRAALNALMAHAIKVATGRMNPPQLFVANSIPPPLDFKKKPVSSNERLVFANKGEAVAKTDRSVAAFRGLQPEGPRRLGFDMGIGATDGHTLWGPGKQRFLDALSFDEKLGFRDAAAFSLGRNNNPVLASIGAKIAEKDPEVAAARARRTSGLFWLGFDVATGIFGDPDLDALGNTSLGPGAEKIRATTSDGEHVLLPTDESRKGFDASVAFHLGRKRG
ncbi:hypothetical protein ACN28E_06695 [Archangium lansingense]|uniref:hypothetical protein n=1 Tax=Archangium lansingense TaxID=2995310 RepID=UPI003B7DF27D